MDLPAFKISASLAFDKGDPKKFRIKAYDGGLLRLADKPFPVVVDLKGMRTEGQVKALLHHDSARPVGHMDTVEISNSIEAGGCISVPGEDSEHIAASQASGFQWDASIGAIQDPGTAEVVPPGQRVKVNGREFVGPLIVARSTVLREVSFVGTGAGSNTSAVLVAALSWDSSMSGTTTTTENGGKATEVASPAVTTAQFETLQASLKTANDQIQTMQREKVVGLVDSFALQHGVDLGNPIVASLKTKARDGGVTESGVELEILRAAAPDFSKWKVAGHVPPTREQEATSAVIEASMLMTIGCSEDDLKAWKFDDKTIEAALSSRHRGASLHSMMGAVIRASGGHFTGNFKSNEFIRAAFTAERDIKASGFSTVSLTNILENVANKMLLKGYEGVATTWQEICAIRSLNDFKPAAMYRLDNAGQYQKVGQDGKLKHIELTDAKYSLQLETYGAILVLPRQKIISDDLGAFGDIYRMFGDMAGSRIEELIWVMILSNPGNFFSVGNKNYMQGANTALSIDSLKAARAIFAKQVGPNKKPISSKPDRMAVGVGNFVLAEQIFTERNLANVVSETNKPANNPMVSKYRPIECPWIDNTDILDDQGKAITGQSQTAWYLFMDPNVRAAVNIGFLNGNRRPTVESTEADFDSLGIKTRSYHDFGGGMGDTTAAFKSNGAAE